jgi:hypothetical protein
VDGSRRVPGCQSVLAFATPPSLPTTASFADNDFPRSAS